MRRRPYGDIGAPSAMIMIVAIIFLAPIPANIAHQQGTRSASPLPTTAFALHPGAMQFSASVIQGDAAPASSTNPIYDEQIGSSFTQDATALTYNVTAVAQADSDGYGPAYILNGLSSSGYWYQVGISWHWPNTNGGYNPTFGFSYEVFGPNGKPVFPTNGGAGLGSFSKVVHSGDSVLLSLTFSGTNVQMLAQDWATGATARTTYSRQGAQTFVGNPSNPSSSVGYFSGLMTEWYHVAAYYGNEGKVTYTNQHTALSSAWLWVDEFKTGSSGAPLFYGNTQTPVAFANEQQVYPFSSNGATVYGSAHEFITGLLGAATSSITLTPSAPEQASPTFTATYMLAGLAQSAELQAGANLVQADPGTQVAISGDSSASSAPERWVFSGAGGPPLVLSAGANATYVYYDIVEETVSYLAAGGSIPASSGPTLIYQAPPAAPSSAAAPVTMKQPLGTAPVTIFAILGSEARVNGTISGVAGERWSAGVQVWDISAPNVIPNPIQLYHQFEASIRYSIVGGGTPPLSPQFTSTSLGSPANVQLSADAATTGWFDAGGAYSFTNTIYGLNGPASGERWLDSANGLSSVSSPDEALVATYTHQFYADLGVNDPRGGAVSQRSGWFAAGSTLNASASASAQWKFEMWNSTGAAAYAGTSPSLAVKVTTPLHEEAIFYVQLKVSADSRTNIAFSYGAQSETVPAGTTKEIYVPPAAVVTLRATPSTFVYSFASWKGAGLDNNTKPQVSLTVSFPTTALATTTYNFPVISGAAAVLIIAVAASSIAIRNRRRKAFGTRM